MAGIFDPANRVLNAFNSARAGRGVPAKDLGHLVSSITRSSKPPAEGDRVARLAPERQAMSTILALCARAVSAPVHRRFRAWNADVRLSTSRLFRGRPAGSQPPAQIRIGESGAERALNG